MEQFYTEIIKKSCSFLFYSSDVKFHGTVKPLENGHSQKDKKLVLKTKYCLMKVESIAECSPWSFIKLPFVFKIFVLSGQDHFLSSWVEPVLSS